MIVKVEPQTWEYPDGTTEYALVWLVMENGDVYSRSMLKEETLEGLVAKFEATKQLDEECALFKTSSER